MNCYCNRCNQIFKHAMKYLRNRCCGLNLAENVSVRLQSRVNMLFGQFYRWRTHLFVFYERVSVMRDDRSDESRFPLVTRRIPIVKAPRRRFLNSLTIYGQYKYIHNGSSVETTQRINGPGCSEC